MQNFILYLSVVLKKLVKFFRGYFYGAPGSLQNSNITGLCSTDGLRNIHRFWPLCLVYSSDVTGFA